MHALTGRDALKVLPDPKQIMLPKPSRKRQKKITSSETDEVRAKREPSLCNEYVKRHFRFFSYTAAIE